MVPTPLVGGLAIVPPLLLVLLVQAFGNPPGDATRNALLGLGVATLFAFLVGLADDRTPLPAMKRFAICGLFFSVALGICPSFVVSDLVIQSVGLRIHLGIGAIFFSVLCLLALENGLNMVDGRNGLAIGLSLIWLGALLSFGAHPSNLPVMLLMVSLVVILLPNWRGKLFLGDAGSYAIGAFLGFLTIWIHRSNIGLHTADVLTLYIVPILDMLRLCVTRVWARRSPCAADQNHLHHHLDRALGWPRGCWVYFAIIGLPILAMRTGLLGGLYATAAAGSLYLITLLLATRFKVDRVAVATSQAAA
ncbi:MAG: MraY family glycosyltransferase [Chakrabartia sp.]